MLQYKMYRARYKSLHCIRWMCDTLRSSREIQNIQACGPAHRQVDSYHRDLLDGPTEPECGELSTQLGHTAMWLEHDSAFLPCVRILPCPWLGSEARPPAMSMIRVWGPASCPVRKQSACSDKDWLTRYLCLQCLASTKRCLTDACLEATRTHINSYTSYYLHTHPVRHRVLQCSVVLTHTQSTTSDPLRVGHSRKHAAPTHTHTHTCWAKQLQEKTNTFKQPLKAAIKILVQFEICVCIH